MKTTCTNFKHSVPFQHTGGNRNLEESFVMLAGSASLLKQAPTHHVSSHTPRQPLDSRFAQMARVFEIASGATKVLNSSGQKPEAVLVVH